MDRPPPFPMTVGNHKLRNDKAPSEERGVVMLRFSNMDFCGFAKVQFLLGHEIESEGIQLWIPAKIESIKIVASPKVTNGDSYNFLSAPIPCLSGGEVEDFIGILDASKKGF
ncbi:hypothetical protein Tco_0800066 [Tanacetum coccineum]|uniref:Uncharacterized protein n=1 Tax=Tanacetum coccineum TaxID=301880 RepID=A0ABQ4ZWG6_9ASTR